MAEVKGPGAERPLAYRPASDPACRHRCSLAAARDSARPEARTDSEGGSGGRARDGTADASPGHGSGGKEADGRSAERATREGEQPEEREISPPPLAVLSCSSESLP